MTNIIDTAPKLLNQLIDFCRRNPDFKAFLWHLHPTTHLALSHSDFSDDMNEEEMETKFSELNLNSPANIIQTLSSEKWLQIDYLTAKSFYALRARDPKGTSWNFAHLTSKPAQPLTKPYCIHFYGYKGGQGRTAVLTQLAKKLSLDGWKVLVVDADFEAPSCHQVFNAVQMPIESTVFGLLEKDIEIKLTRVHAPDFSPPNGPGVYLLGAKPSDISLSLYLSKISSLSNSALVLESITNKILKHAENEKFDAILIDHRTGLSNNTFPLMNAFPGTGVLICRLDGLWKTAQEALRIFIKEAPKFVVLNYVPFSVPAEKFESLYGTEIGDLEQMALEALESKDPLQLEELEIDRDIRPNFSTWFNDECFRNTLLPDEGALDPRNQKAIHFLRSNIGLAVKKEFEPFGLKPSKQSSSGALSDGVMLLTDTLKIAWDRQGESLFFLGRKGSGKTSALKLFTERNFGTPLIVDELFLSSAGKPFGLNFPSFKDLKEKLSTQSSDTDHKNFWRMCFLVGAKATSGLSADLESVFDSISSTGMSSALFVTQMNQLPGKVYFLDSFETFCPSQVLERMLSNCFEVLREIEVNCKEHKFWVFLRRDMLSLCGQNHQQLMDGREYTLEWKYKEMLNLLVCRLAEKEILKSISLQSEVQRSRELGFQNIIFTEQECYQFLLEVFPREIPVRGNPSLTVYLQGYFSDSQDESKSESYNPRFVHFFVTEFSKLFEQNRQNYELIAVKIIEAQSEAAKKFIEGLAEEVKALVKGSDNGDQVDTVLRSLSGFSVPFKIPELREQVLGVNGQIANTFDSVLEALKKLGVMTDHETLPELKRFSKLVRASLNMKINRSISSRYR